MLAVGAGGGSLDIFFSRLSFLSSFLLLLETARVRQNYCLKGPLNPNQATNEPTTAKVAHSNRKEKSIFVNL